MTYKDRTKEKDPSPQIWVEKYRPRTVSGITHQTEVVSTLQHYVTRAATRADLPHLLFYGPPGSGKTSTALALTRDLFGQYMRSRVLELNASDERGIHIVRDKIKTFAQQTVSAASSGKQADGKFYPCPNFKVIILDEADAITVDAQTALRRTMEAFSRGTRFILICNYVSRIIGPLTSRCAKFRFQAVPKDAMLICLRRISRAEGVLAGDEVLGGLIEAAEGDLRKAINTLQSAFRMGGVLNMHAIAAAACLVPKDVVERFKQVIESNGTNGEVRKVCEDVVKEGYAIGELLKSLGEIDSWNELQKAQMALVVAQAEFAVNEGCDELLQLYDVGCRLAKIGRSGEHMATLMAT